ncbi:hypothetical protein [Miniphocaeibacter massiliensis]|uniref:hypothetical protein n=1 Tax=Miniphocaeibacter massiliensis TaxID=2041841 RepID=UPI000C0687E8|nr:hypothetical protein [Miniphocaeibacter massiliensis]
MKKTKNKVVILLIISLVFSILLGSTAFFLIGALDSGDVKLYETLKYLFLFFFISTPLIIILSLISLSSIKLKDDKE